MKSIQGLFFRTLKRTAFCALLTFSPTISFAATYYVSSSAGNDANSGLSTTLPWRTLSKVNATAFAAGDQILFQRGDTFYGSLNVSRSGAAGSPITYGAFGTGANPVITGFSTVSGWTNIGGNIWESTSPVTGLSTVKLVSINDVNTPMGRYPNSGYLTFQSHSGQSSITSSSLTGTPNWAGAEAVVRLFSYILDRKPIASQSGSTLTFGQNLMYEPQNGFGFFIQNSPKTLDQQNEWYFDPSTKKLQIYSTSMPVNVKVPTINYLLSLQGSYITLDGLSFSGANEVAIYNYSTVISNLTIRNSTISFSGNKGVQVWNEYFTMENSTISDSNNIGLDLPAGNSNAIIRNNTIQNSGLFAGMGENYSAVNIANNNNMIVEYNRVLNAGYNGIGWWGGSNVLVKNNYVDTFCKILEDGGGIYFYEGKGGRITGNISLNGVGLSQGIANPEPSGTGIYSDDNSTGFEIDHNTVSGVYGLGIFIHNTTYTSVHDNVVFNNGKQFATAENLPIGVNHITVTNNQFIAKTATQRAANFFSAQNDLATIGTLDFNFYARPIDDRLTIAWYQPSIGGSGTLGTFENWRTYIGQEVSSRKSPQAVTSESDFQFEFNASKVAKTVTLSRPMIDIKGTKYSGSITLQPFTSIVLMADATASTTSPSPTPTATVAPSPTPTATIAPSPTPTATIAPSPTPTSSGDTTPPVVTGFSIPATSTSLSINISNFTASDNVGVTGYLLTEAAMPPLASSPNWAMSAATYTFSSYGTKTLFAWAKDAAGNVSASRSASIVISSPADTTPPVVTGFSIPATSASLSINISNFTASDDVGVTGYLLTETSTIPSPSATGWAMSAATYTFSSAGTKSLYAWAKDAAGNVSASVRADIVISIQTTTTAPSDTMVPVITAFSIPSTASSLTVSITSFTASDNVGVTGYLLTEAALPPLASAPGWSSTKPTAYVFSSAGTKVLYAWVKDAAGNVSAYRSGTVTITLKTRLKRVR